MTVTKKSHPHVFEAFREIELDNGMIDRAHPARDVYVIPDKSNYDVNAIDAALQALTEEDFYLMTVGEESERDAMILRTPGEALAVVNQFLESFFNGEFDEA